MSNGIPSDARHPWLAALTAQPEQEVQRLMARQAAIWPFHASDLPDAVALMLGHLEPDDEALRALDTGLLKWLEANRHRRPRDPRDHQAQVLRTIDAFDIIARVPIRRCVESFWSSYVLWYSWADQYDLAPNADLRGAFLRTLAVTQERLADPRSERYMPFWLEVCSRAGRSYPDDYVDFGLLGLRCLPLPPLPDGGVSNASLCVTGLMKWAAARRGLWSDFSWRWLALKHAFPRYNEYWRDLFEQIVFPGINSLERDFYRAWAETVGFRRPKHEGEKRASKPRKEEVLAFVSRITKVPVREAINYAIKLVEHRERYAQETGISIDVVKTACNLGQRLLRDSRGSPAQRSAVALEFAMAALRWEPQNTHGWALWRDALFAAGRMNDAELVAWEAIRRFPEVAILAIDLSLSWIAQRKEQHARALLEETVRTTNNAIARNLLATLLLPSSEVADTKEAKRLLKLGVGEGRIDSRNILAGFLIREGSLAEAEALLRGTLELKEDLYATAMLAEILMRRRDSASLEDAETRLRRHTYDMFIERLLIRLLLLRRREGDREEAVSRLKKAATADADARALLQKLAPEVKRQPIQEAGDDSSADAATLPVSEPHSPHGGSRTEPLAKAPDGARLDGNEDTGVPGDKSASLDDGALFDDVIGAVVADVHRSAASEENLPDAGSIRTRQAREPTPDSYMMTLVRPFGQLRRSAFLYLHGDEPEKHEAEEILLSCAMSDDLPLARFLLLGLQPWRAPDHADLCSGSLGLALLSALRTQSVNQIAKIESRYPQEFLMCAAVRNKIAHDVGSHSEAVPEQSIDQRNEQRLGPASFTLLRMARATKRKGTKVDEAQLMAALIASFDIPMAA